MKFQSVEKMALIPYPYKTEAANTLKNLYPSVMKNCFNATVLGDGGATIDCGAIGGSGIGWPFFTACSLLCKAL